ADALHLGLAAQFALGANLAGYARDFAGERVELIDHRIDGVFELQNLAAHIHRDLAGETAVGHSGCDFGDVADLSGEVAGHGVDRLRDALPVAADALDDGLAAELALGADFAGHTGDFGGEGAELIDHRIDGVLELQDFAEHIHGDFAGEIAA